jgi:hypothetical protein
VSDVFALLVAFQAKHFLADYPLQGRYMLGKFNERGWVLPLASHAAVHAVGTFVIAWLFGAPWLAAVLLALLDGCIHFAVDRVKASPKLLGRWNTDRPYFWWVLGGDQMAHHLTHYALIWLLVLP